VHVHISNLAAQSGSSLFLHTNPTWVYDKNETLPTPVPEYFTHLISEYPVSAYEKAGWRTVECVDGFDRWSINLDFLRSKLGEWDTERLGAVGYLVYLSRHVLEMQMSPKLCILERRT